MSKTKNPALTEEQINALREGDHDPWHDDYSRMCCEETSPRGYLCTAPRRHPGQHVAAGTAAVVAVWPNEVTP